MRPASSPRRRTSGRCCRDFNRMGHWRYEVLSVQIVQSINKHLSTGDITAALAPLEKAKDLRWNELPALEKTTTAALTRLLRENEVPAEQLVEAVFHSNSSIRKFVRKIVQSLKADAAPIAKPLRARLEKYLRETIAVRWRPFRKDSELHHAQKELVENAVELLRRCDVDEFMDCMGTLYDEWVPQQREWREWLRAVRSGNPPPVEGREIQLPNGTMWIEPADYKIPKTLMDEYVVTSTAFVKAFHAIAGYDVKPSAEGDKSRAHLWRWLENALFEDDAAARVEGWSEDGEWSYVFGRQMLLERAVPLLAKARDAGRAGSPIWRELLETVEEEILHPRWESKKSLPASLTPDAMRTLQYGDKRDDKRIERLAQAAAKQQAKPKTAAPPKSDEEDEDEDALPRPSRAMLDQAIKEMRNLLTRYGNKRKRQYSEEMSWVPAQLAAMLYQRGSKQDIAEARTLLDSAGMESDPDAISTLARLARKRRDYDLLLPLVRLCAHQNKNLVTFWDDFRKAQPDRVPEVVRVLLPLIADTTDADSAWTPLAMLSKVEKQTDLFAPHANLLAQCVESTLPNVARFALALLEKMPHADCDWATLCEHAGEKLWSDNAGLAKDAARFLGKVGAKNEDAASATAAALCDALSLNSLPLLEVVLRAMAQIRSKQEVELDKATRKRIEQLRAEQPPRLGRLCERVMRKT